MTSLSAIAAGLDTASASRVALVSEGVSLTYAELGARVFAAARRFADAGVKRGSRVVLVAANRVETVIAIHALIELGAVLVPIHPRFTAGEAEVIRANVAPCIALGDVDLAGMEAAPTPTLLPSIPLSDTLAILHTSGTTGVPKGAVLTRQGFVAAAAGNAQNVGIAPEERWLLAMPICHVGGLSILMRMLLARRTVVLHPRFDARAVLASIEEDAVTLLSVVPTMLHALLEADHRGVLAKLRGVLIGGAATPFGYLEKCAARGIAVITTYGLTEACAQATAQPFARRFRAEPGSGRALTGVELRIAGDNLEPVEAGQVGRILLRGPTITSGYFGAPPRLPESWFDTGDLGAQDETGTLFVHARRTDLLVTGGENVYPAEVERALEASANIERALVFGLPDERWGVIIAAAIVMRPGASLDRAHLAADLAARLAPHKRPRHVAVVPDLPVTPVGKLDRRQATSRFAELTTPLVYAPQADRRAPAPPLESPAPRRSSDR